MNLQNEEDIDEDIYVLDEMTTLRIDPKTNAYFYIPKSIVKYKNNFWNVETVDSKNHKAIIEMKYGEQKLNVPITELQRINPCVGECLLMKNENNHNICTICGIDHNTANVRIHEENHKTCVLEYKIL